MRTLITALAALPTVNVLAPAPTAGQELVPYDLVSQEDISHKAMGGRPLSDFTARELAKLPTDRRLSVRVVVPDTIQREQVTPTACTVLSELRRSHPGMDEAIIFLFSDRDLATRGAAYDVARATWSTGGEIGGIAAEIARSDDRSRHELAVTIRDDLESYLARRGRSETRWGMSEEQRREVFRELVRAEHRAGQEAEEKYPTNLECVSAARAEQNFERQGPLADSLLTVYERQVRQQYGISKAVADSISVEGISESWTMPELPPPAGC